MRIHLVIVNFDEPIPPSELSWFRGAMIRLADNNPLFHNHQGQGYNYVYPKIQYKLINGYPAVLGINEGALALKEILSDCNSIHCRLGHTINEFHISSIGEWDENIILTPELNTYFIANWLPLNARNYEEYLRADTPAARLPLLDRIITGNILSFAKGMGVFFDSQVICQFDDIESNGNLTYKDVDLLSFSGSFKSNVQLPQWIGLGKSASLNHGIIIKI